MDGRIIRLVQARESGFIRDEGGRDMLFLRSAWLETDFHALEEGAGVRFDSEFGPET